ncbi:MAG TPA: hypothetical protein DIS76_00410, partial [Rhodospirillaceae bacterium]|nr:hypothetical protein [Rhodospirillaceae bacterium]
GIAPAQAATPKIKSPEEKSIVTKVDAQYAIYGGGMHLIDAELKIDVDKKHYDSTLTARTMGVIGKIFKWWNNVSSKGNVEPRKLQSTQHISENSWMGDRRSVTLIYDGKGGFEKKETFPAPAAENREEVAEELTKNTQDVMSAALTLLQRVSLGENCNQTIAVYDGRRRFNLKFNEIQFEKLPEIRYGIYQGAARRCDMTIERVAGYWKKYQTEWTEDGDAKMRVTFWLAPLTPGGPEVPVRARTYGDFGTVFVHLTGGTMDGQNIKDLLAQNP